MKNRHDRNRRLRSVLLVAAILLVFFSRPGFGQDVANGQATATVLAGLVVTAVQDLQFGNVLQGVAKSTPNNDDANSGIFSVAGATGAGISVYLTLPDYMALPDGSDRMTIAFSSTDAIVDTNATSPATVVAGDGWLDVNPRDLGSLPPTGVVIGSATSQTNLYLGGRVTPAIDQAAGNYAADIICTVAYNGT
ncbi:MAG TPA: hypothetical protein VMY05_02945 [Acidobacteriota bacterium]|nr:hypothetical protein [Acidobacteriota bacterium]